MAKLYFGTSPKGHWLELGSAPGGATSEMLKDGLRVTAVDRAEMDPTVLTSRELKFIKDDCTQFNLRQVESSLQGVFCDMNAEPALALAALVRVLPLLRGPFGITLKLADPKSAQSLVAEFKSKLESHGASHVVARHLWHNRSELCVMGQK
jgi:23S rRNA (cytidine2498-2'-O)-methyltransferase